MYQMMLSDLDETLLIGQHVPVFNQEAIREAKKHGLRFVVATGRSHRMIGDILKERCLHFAIIYRFSIVYENIQSDTFGIYLEVYCFLRFQVLDVVDFDIKYHFEEGFADFLVLHNPAEHEIVGKSQFLILLYCSH